MPERRIEYSQLETDYEFPPSTYKMDTSVLAAYLKAVGETGYLYEGTNLVPPMAIAASAMAALSRGIHLPPGAIHVSQELEFIKTVNAGDSLTSYARVSRKQSRGKFHLLDIDLSVRNQNKQAVLAGKTCFILPPPDNGEQ